VSNYTQSTNFATKDALSPGDPLKIVRGTEINTEFANIAVAVATKLDTTALAAPGPIGATTPSTISATNVQMTSANGGQLAGLRNRVINGDMRIDQRNGGAAVTPAASAYTLDRWILPISQASKLTVRQNLNTIAPPAGFGYQFGISTAVAVSLVAGDYFVLQQSIEGYNVQDFAFGSASAAQITLSFWVRSSLTGTFSGGLGNNANNRSYVFTYSIPAANTWTKISVTIAGDTSGTWTADNTIGLAVRFSLGMGATFSSTAGSWQTGSYYAATSSVSVVGTLSATFYITGVQLEVGPVATPFEQRPIGMELALCQRYYHRITSPTATSGFHMIQINSATGAQGIYPFPVEMRTNPLALETTTAAGDYRINFATINITCSVLPAFNGATNFRNAYVNYTVASGLTPTGGGGSVIAVNTNAYLGWSAEL
jgi:hypothetical protein